MQRSTKHKPVNGSKRVQNEGRKRAVRSSSNGKSKRAGAASANKSVPVELSFRPRTAADDGYMVHLTEEQLGVIHQQSFGEPFPREQFTRYLQSGAPTMVIERAGKRIGYYSYLVSPDQRMHISALVIERSEQARGVGTAVMNRLEQEAKRQGLQVMEVYVQDGNDNSIAFTRKLGFVEAYRFPPNSICFQKRVGAVAL